MTQASNELPKVTKDLVRQVTKFFLLSKYDNPQPIPEFHNEMWELCCSNEKYVVVAAPRGHAKSTAVSHAYAMTSALFRSRRFIVLLSSTESKASRFLVDIASEIRTNEDLREAFEVKKLVTDTKTEIVCEMKDGYKFCIMATGSGPGSKIRGEKWDGMRPDLVICDDVEDDESVMNPDRREKFREWMLKALFPLGGDDCIYRVVGTVLHYDSFLYRALNDEEWGRLCFKAHESFNDFSNLLWPEKWPVERLKKERSVYISQGTPEGYSQEYLNEPMVEGATFFRKSDFLPITEDENLIYYAGGDFAISQKERADKTSFKVAGVNSNGVIKYVHSVCGRWDSKQICDEMFAIQKRFDPVLFFVESDKIEKAIGPFLYDMMGKANDYGDINPYINLEPINPSKDKRTRASPLQGRMRSGSVQWDMDSEWYPEVMEELTRFPRAAHDDHVDSCGIICLGLKKIVEAATPEEIEEEEYYEEFGEETEGMSIICGY